jgi:phosphatidylglycerophosphate synthase
VRCVLIATTSGNVLPATTLAGLSLALRAVLTLQQAGASKVSVVGAPALVASLAADPRVRLPLDAIEPDAKLPEPALVTRFDVVVAPRVLEQLLAARCAAVGEHGPWLVTAGAPLMERPPARVELTGFVHRVDTRQGWQAAQHDLFEACRKPVDGFVSRRLNRRLSLALSKRLVDTPITPNMMTAITFGVAVFASALAARGSYAAVACAGVLMQANSILDGCDGELARVRMQGSLLGQWLDTIGDDLSNVLFWVALGFGASSIEVFGPVLAACGYIAGIANLLAALLNYVMLWHKRSGDFYAIYTGAEHGDGRVVAWLSILLRQDFFLFLVMLLALAGVLAWALPLFAAGAIITLGAAIVRAWRFFAPTAAVQPKST